MLSYCALNRGALNIETDDLTHVFCIHICRCWDYVYEWWVCRVYIQVMGIWSVHTSGGYVECAYEWWVYGVCLREVGL